MFPRVNFTRGYSRLTLLSSEEQTGALLALVLVLGTDKGQEILGPRFCPAFDEARKERAAQFKGKRKRDDEYVSIDASDAESEEGMSVTNEASAGLEEDGEAAIV